MREYKIRSSKVSIALAVMLSLAGCGEKTTQEYLAEGEQAIEQNKVSDAIVQFKNAVRTDLDNPLARGLLGQAYLRQGDYLSAEKELSQALALGSTDENDVISLAISRAKLADVIGVQQVVDEYANVTEQTLQAIYFYAGVAYLNDQKMSEGKDFLQQAKRISPDNNWGRLAHAYSLYAEQEIAQSLEVAESLIATDTNNTEAILLSGHLLADERKFKEAAARFSKYLELTPLDNAVLFFQAEALVGAEKYDDADVVVSRILKMSADQPLANQYKAQIEYSKDNFNDAILYAEKSINSGLGLTVANMIAGASAYQLGWMEQSYSHLKPIEKVLPADHSFQRLIAVVKLKLGYTDEAMETIQNIENVQSSDVELLKGSSVALIEARDFQSAAELLNRAQDLAPDDPSIALQKGNLLLSQKDMTGLESIELALTIDPDREDVELGLALQYLKFGLDEKAKVIASKWLESEDQKLSGQLLMGIISVKENNEEDALSYFDSVLAVEPENLAALYNLAILNEERDVEKSRALYQQLITLSPQHVGAINRYAKLLSANGNGQESISFLEGQKSNSEETFLITLGIAEAYLLNKDYESAIKALLDVEDNSNYPSAYWLMLGDSYMQNNQMREAFEVYTKASEKDPSNFILELRIIGLLELSGDYSGALARAKKAKKLYPDSDKLDLLLAHYELLDNNLAESQKYLIKLKSKGIKHPLLSLVEGQIALSQRDYEKAVPLLRSSYQAAPSRLSVIQLARAYKFSSKDDQAKEVLEKHLVNNPDAKMRMILTSLYSEDEISKKVEQYELANKELPDDVVILNNLAWNLYRINQSTKARGYIEQAYKLNSNYLPIIETYGVILADLNDPNAGRILQNAIDSGSTSDDVKVKLASSLIASGDKKAAKQLLESVKPNSQFQDKAKVLLESLG